MLTNNLIYFKLPTLLSVSVYILSKAENYLIYTVCIIYNVLILLVMCNSSVHITQKTALTFHPPPQKGLFKKEKCKVFAIKHLCVSHRFHFWSVFLQIWV